MGNNREEARKDDWNGGQIHPYPEYRGGFSKNKLLTNKQRPEPADDTKEYDANDSIELHKKQLHPPWRGVREQHNAWMLDPPKAHSHAKKGCPDKKKTSQFFCPGDGRAQEPRYDLKDYCAGYSRNADKQNTVDDEPNRAIRIQDA
jgi:hypothetical protein